MITEILLPGPGERSALWSELVAQAEDYFEIRRWMRALRRRGQKHWLTWPRLVALADCWLPRPTILHPYPNLRFDARHPR